MNKQQRNIDKILQYNLYNTNEISSTVRYVKYRPQLLYNLIYYRKKSKNHSIKEKILLFVTKRIYYQHKIRIKSIPTLSDTHNTFNANINSLSNDLNSNCKSEKIVKETLNDPSVVYVASWANNLNSYFNQLILHFTFEMRKLFDPKNIQKIEKEKITQQIGYATECIKLIVTNILIFKRENNLYPSLDVEDKEGSIEAMVIITLCKNIFCDKYTRFYDHLMFLEIIKLIIIMQHYFTLIQYKSDEFTSSCTKLFEAKFNSSHLALYLYSCVGLSSFSCFHKASIQVLNHIIVNYFKQTQHETLNILNLCTDILFPEILKSKEPYLILRSIHTSLNEKNNSHNHYSIIFHNIVKSYELVHIFGPDISTLIIQYLIRSVNQYQNYNIVQKKLTVQLLGIVIYWLKYEKEKVLPQDNSSTSALSIGISKTSLERIDKMKENTFKLLTYAYKNLFSTTSQGSETEYTDLIKRYLIYIRELMRISDISVTNYFFIQDTDKNSLKSLSLPYFYYLKFTLLFIKRKEILNKLDYIFDSVKLISQENSINIKFTNDSTLVLKLLIDFKTYEKMNIVKDELTQINYRTIELLIEKGITDFFDIYLNNFNKKRGKLIIDVDFETIIKDENRTPELHQQILNSFKNKITHNDRMFDIYPHFELRYFSLFYFYLIKSYKFNYLNLPVLQLLLSKENFEENNNKNNTDIEYIHKSWKVIKANGSILRLSNLFTNYYSNSSIEFLNNNLTSTKPKNSVLNESNSTFSINNIINSQPPGTSSYNIAATMNYSTNTIKAKDFISTVSLNTIDLSKQSDILAKYYFENWYLYSLYLLPLLREEDNNRKTYFENSDNEYFLCFMNYISIITTYDQLENMKIVDYKTNNKLYILEVMMETILIGFLFVFHHHKIFNQYKSSLIKLYLMLVEIMKNTNIQGILERLIKILIDDSSKLDSDEESSIETMKLLEKLKDSSILLENLTNDITYLTNEDKNLLIIELLKVYEYSVKKIPINLLNIFLKHLEDYKEPLDKNIAEILRMIMINSKTHEIQVRERIYNLFEKYKGQSIYEKLKWIFHYDMLCMSSNILNNSSSKTDTGINVSWVLFSVDFLLNHFKYNKNIILKGKLSHIGNNKQQATSFNLASFMKNIREIILSEINYSQKIWFSIFPQIWKLLRKDEQESLSLFINDYLISIVNNSQTNQKFPLIVKYIMESFINCNPIIKINPELTILMVKNYTCWNSVVFYLENMFNHNLNIERTFLSLSKIYESLKEEDYNIGLKRKFLKKKKQYLSSIDTNSNILVKYQVNAINLTEKGLFLYQGNNYESAETVFNQLFNEYENMIDKIDYYDSDQSDIKLSYDNKVIDNDIIEYNIDEDLISPNILTINKIISTDKRKKSYLSKGVNIDNLNDNLEGEEVLMIPELGIWQTCLMDCLKNNNKWKDVKSFAIKTNNIELKTEAMWNLGEWQEIDKMNITRAHHLPKLNQIYMMMRQELGKIDNYYQNICMDGIKIYFSDFSAYPLNFEKLNYHYYLIFQQLVEAWESTNTLKEIERIIKEKDKRLPDFRENLIMWRDRIPHICEGFPALKSILDPRNFLFDIMRDYYKKIYNDISTSNLVSSGLSYNQSNQAETNFPNISDHLWNNVIYLKYARKLRLNSVYSEYHAKFSLISKGLESYYPVEIFKKNMEDFKFIKHISKNYEHGVKIANDLIDKIPILNVGNSNSTSNSLAQLYANNATNKIATSNTSLTNIANPNFELDKEIKSSYFAMKGYFLHKLDNYKDSIICYKEALSLNKTNYKIWSMTKSILLVILL